MRRFAFTICLLLGLAAVGFAQAAKSKVDFEMMTWPEIQEAIREGKTTVLVMNGGTEQRGPQNVNGGHTLMGRAVVKAVADKLGNAIVAPVLPFSAIDTNPDLPGTIGITVPTYVAIQRGSNRTAHQRRFQERCPDARSGGAYRELAEMAKKLDAKYSSQGVRVVFCGDVYRKASDDIAKWLTDNGYPKDGHAGISDTSLMLYLGGDDGWVRKELVATALGDMPAPAGQKADPKIPRINNGITGDARRSSVAIGKRYFDIKVDYAVTQIHQSLATK